MWSDFSNRNYQFKELKIVFFIFSRGNNFVLLKELSTMHPEEVLTFV